MPVVWPMTLVSKPSTGNVSSTGFISLPEPTRFHDAHLIKATQEINRILERVEKDRKTVTKVVNRMSIDSPFVHPTDLGATVK